MINYATEKWMFTCAPIIITYASHYRHNTMDWLWLTNRNDDDNNCNSSSRLQMTNTCAHTADIYTIHISHFTIPTHSFYCHLFSNFVFIKSIKIKYLLCFMFYLLDEEKEIFKKSIDILWLTTCSDKITCRTISFNLLYIPKQWQHAGNS